MGPLLVTSAQGSSTTDTSKMWQTSTPMTATGNATLTVNDSTTYQVFNGFGAAFNEKGWNYISMLSTSDQQKALTLLFDASNGAHFMYGRIPIGTNDYAMSRYTDDEVTSGGTDYNMTSFSITEDKKYLIPYVQAAQKVNPSLQFWASPWTPPTWMKTGTAGIACTCGTTGNGPCNSPGKQSTSPFDGMNMKSDTMTLQALAMYYLKWVQAYAAQNIMISTLMPQNEPNYPENYPSAMWDPTTYDTFLATYLGPTFKNNGMNTQIFLGTMSNDNTGADPAIITKVLADPTAMSFIHGFALQWNMEGNPTAGQFSSNISGVTSSSLPKWQTEHQCGNYPWNPAGSPAYNSTQAPNDYYYGTETWGHIRDWVKAGVTTYSAWNTVLDPQGNGNDTCRQWYQESLLVVSGTTLIITPAYYVFRHVSQYIQPGATRVATTGSLDALAFKNPDGSHVTIMYNSGSSAVATTLSAGSGKFQFSVPANGFATVVN
jgi:glucosylceramidase